LEYGLWVELGCVLLNQTTRDGWLSLRCLWTTNLSTRTRSWKGDLPIIV
jgi:hypothetical protein